MSTPIPPGRPTPAPSRRWQGALRFGFRLGPAVLAVVMLSAAPAPGMAQRAGRAMRGVGQGSVGDPAPNLSAADVERLDPVAMLIARASAFALADSQVVRLGDIQRRLHARNAPHLRSLDSVLAEIRRHAADTSGSPGDRLVRQGNDRITFTAILGRIRDADDAAAEEAMALFSGPQLRRVYNVVREQRTMMRAIVRGGTVPAERISPNDP
ncbi:MAG TPA: hypothetical protein VNE60_03680 [Gemmatimonadaceae bacterium]|nr:hypothetical protein [Gemmatimonadaceae bacterium]